MIILNYWALIGQIGYQLDYSYCDPTIVKSLGLVTEITDSGLIGITETGEKVLRMRTWLTVISETVCIPGCQMRFHDMKAQTLLFERNIFKD